MHCRGEDRGRRRRLEREREKAGRRVSIHTINPAPKLCSSVGCESPASCFFLIQLVLMKSWLLSFPRKGSVEHVFSFFMIEDMKERINQIHKHKHWTFNQEARVHVPKCCRVMKNVCYVLRIYETLFMLCFIYISILRPTRRFFKRQSGCNA